MGGPSLEFEFSAHAYVQDLTALLNTLDHQALELIAQLFCSADAERNTVFCCGNGGSAATAVHFAADLCKLTCRPGRVRLRVLSLNDAMPAITAAANDFDYREIFAEQLRALMSPGDIVIGFSTSGRSPNVVRAIEFANENGGITVGVTGATGGPLAKIAQNVLVIPSTNVQRVEDVSLVATHLLCMMTLQRLCERDQMVPARMGVSGF
jgi:D-sedoheptulose 7-phosphate isomerase